MYVNSRKQGDYGVGQAVSYFTKIGWTVCIPISDSQRYDLIVDDGEKIYRVQVKTSNSHTVNLRTLGGNRSGTGITKYFDKSEVELVFIALLDGRWWLFPSDVLKRTSVSVLNKAEFRVG